MPATSSPATALRYRDVAAAVDWLCSAFGFQKQTVVTAESGVIDYAQLTCGRAMLMLAPVRDTPLDKLMKQPDEIGRAATQSCYLVVDDADAHHARAKDAGAEIVLDLQDDDFGGRGYTCRDPEGHIWMFGTYDPWQGKHPEPAAVRGGRRPMVLAGLALTVVASLAAVAWVGGILRQPSAVSSAVLVHEVAEKADGEAKERVAEAAEQAARELRAQLHRERAAKMSADKASEDALKRVAEERRTREAAERAANEAREQLERERVAKTAAEKASAGVLERAAADQRARETAERAAQKAREELERERAAVTAAEMAKEFALGRADEERLAREAAERAVEEAQAQLGRERVAKAPGGPIDADAPKRVAKVQQALEQAQKQAAEAQRAREAAERAAEEAREQLARERAAKTAAWKVVGQLTRQLQQVQGTSEAAVADDDGSAAAPKKARPRRKQKKAPEPE